MVCWRCEVWHVSTWDGELSAGRELPAVIALAIWGFRVSCLENELDSVLKK